MGEPYSELSDRQAVATRCGESHEDIQERAVGASLKGHVLPNGPVPLQHPGGLAPILHVLWGCLRHCLLAACMPPLRSVHERP